MVSVQRVYSRLMRWTRMSDLIMKIGVGLLIAGFAIAMLCLIVSFTGLMIDEVF